MKRYGIIYRFQSGSDLDSKGTYMIGERDDGKFVKYEDYKRELEYYKARANDLYFKLAELSLPKKI